MCFLKCCLIYFKILKTFSNLSFVTLRFWKLLKIVFTFSVRHCYLIRKYNLASLQMWCHTHIHTYGQFNASIQPWLHVLERWKETGVPWESLQRENRKTPYRKTGNWTSDQVIFLLCVRLPQCESFAFLQEKLFVQSE